MGARPSLVNERKFPFDAQGYKSTTKACLNGECTLAERRLELDLLAAGPADTASYAASVAKDLTALCSQHGLEGLAALFSAATREAGRAAARLGGAPVCGPADAGGPASRPEAARYAADLSAELVLLCEAAGLASLATLFFAAREEAEGSVPRRERRAG